MGRSGPEDETGCAGERGLRSVHGLRQALRPVAVGVGALGLLLGILGADSGVAGAASRDKSVARSDTVTNFADYVGGHGKANSKLSPVYIGAVNQQTATDAPTPTWSTGVELAQKYLNEHTGGIDGHPVKIVLCKVPTTVGSAAKCGQEFANNSQITAVAAGGMDVGNTALESALKPAKKPLFFGVSLSTVDEKYTYGFILYGTTAQVQAPMATAAKKYIHAKSVSIVYPSNIPGNVYQAGVVAAAMKYNGIDTVYKVGFTTSQTNLSGPFEAAHVGKTTLFILVNSGGPACSDTYLTIKSLGLTKTKVLVNVPCATPTVAKADGGQLPPDWYYLTAVPMPGANTPALSAFLTLAGKYGDGAVAHNAWTGNGFGQVVTIAKYDTEILKSHKKLTPAAVFKKARAFRGPVALGAPDIHCGAFKGTPATCNDLDRFYQNTKPTVMVPLGGWIPPPKGFKPAIT